MVRGDRDGEGEGEAMRDELDRPKFTVIGEKAVRFDLLITENAYTGRRYGLQEFAVIAELLMVSRDKIHAVWRC